MYYIKDTIENEIVIQKSRFITHAYRVDSIEEVNEILAKTKKTYYDATHNCYAYILGDNQDIQKASDDGEPQKTAGFPMLDVLKKMELTNILVIVTRYFGGILLGAGGLIRAYSSSVSMALESVPLYKKQLLTKVKLNLSYSLYNSILSLIKNFEVCESSFSTEVILIVGIKKAALEDAKADLLNKCNGNIGITILDDYFEEILK